MKKFALLVALAVCASVAGCRSVPKMPSLPANPPAVVGVVDEPVPPPKPASPTPATAVVAPTPLPPTKVAVAKPSGAPLPAPTPSWGVKPPARPLPPPPTPMELMQNGIISTRSAVEQVRTDLGEDVEALANKLAALEKRVARAEGNVSAPAPTPAVPSARSWAQDLRSIVDEKAWEGIVRSLTSARPTMAEIHLERLRQPFRGSDEELLSVLLGKTTDSGVADWLREQLGPGPAQ